jgi:hypothetical protein
VDTLLGRVVTVLKALDLCGYTAKTGCDSSEGFRFVWIHC